MNKEVDFEFWIGIIEVNPNSNKAYLNLINRFAHIFNILKDLNSKIIMILGPYSENIWKQ